MHPLLAKVEAKYIKDTIPSTIKPGDTIRVFNKVKEGNKERLQAFEGIVIAIRGEGISKMMKVRKISYGVGVERTFPMHSPKIEKIEIIKHGKPRRAKLFYLRERVGKRALRVKEDARYSGTHRHAKSQAQNKTEPEPTVAGNQTTVPQQAKGPATSSTNSSSDTNSNSASDNKSTIDSQS